MNPLLDPAAVSVVPRRFFYLVDCLSRDHFVYYFGPGFVRGYSERLCGALARVRVCVRARARTVLKKFDARAILSDKKCEKEIA